MQHAEPAIPARTVAYGPHEDQLGDLFLPPPSVPRSPHAIAPRAPVVCILHGGFWRMPYGRDQMTAIARDLAARGFVVWNLEYRRLGAPGGGWPGTFEDIAAGIDHLTTLAADGIAIDLNRVTVVGHSAGGHLALWSAQGNATCNSSHARRLVRVAAAVGLAPVADLALAHALGCGSGAVAELLGGSPDEQPERYSMSSPIAMLPFGVRQLIVHGTMDDALPIVVSRNYVHAAIAAGDDVQLVELAGAGHMDFLDPASAAHATLCNWLVAS